MDAIEMPFDRRPIRTTGVAACLAALSLGGCFSAPEVSHPLTLSEAAPFSAQRPDVSAKPLPPATGAPLVIYGPTAAPASPAPARVALAAPAADDGLQIKRVRLGPN